MSESQHASKKQKTDSGVVVTASSAPLRHKPKSKDSKRSHWPGGIPCTRCDQTFRAAYDLEIHMNEHDGLRPHVCDTCGNAYINVAGLNHHKRTHSGQIVMNYKCTEPGCNKIYEFESELVRHSHGHTGLKPHKCDKCDKAYTAQGALNRHKKAAH